MSSTILKSDAFKMVDVPIADSWPAAMLRTSAELVLVDKASVYEQLMGKLDPKATIRNIDSPMIVQDIERPSNALAFATYCTSSLWSQNVKNTKGLTAFNLRIGDVTIPIFSMKGEQNAKLADGMFSVDDAIHSSTLYMNKIVDDFYKKKDNTWAMTPLARICMTDSNIKALSEEMNASESAIVKTLNISCSRKAYQLYGMTENCSLEFVIAAIMRTSFAQNASATTKSIAAKNIAKCANKAGVAGVDTKKVSIVLSYMVGNNSGMDMEVDSIMELAKKMSKERSTALAKIGKTTSAFEASSSK